MSVNAWLLEMAPRTLCSKVRSWGSSANPVRPDVGYVRTLRLLWGSAIKLCWYLGMPGLWLWRFLLLLGFVVAMLPVFVPVLVHFLRSPRILKNIPYGPSIRHQLDVYLPSEAAVARARRQCPIVVFVSGGAWVIGYKLWAFLMGCVLQERGVVFVCPDYRNFPQGQAPDMVRDVAEALKWAQANAALLGGDPKNMTLVGQSAGAHLVLMCLIEAAELEAAQGGAGAAMAGFSGRPHSPRHRRELHDAPGEHTAGGQAVYPAEAEWGRGLSMAGIRRCVGVSGPYDLEALADKLAARGLPRGLLQALMGDLLHQSPVCRVRRMTPTSLRRLPPVILYHGTADLTVPCAQTTEMAATLQAAGARVSVELFQGKSHTDPILEDPGELGALGGPDPLLQALLSHIFATSAECVTEGVCRGAGGLPSWLPACVVVPCVRVARRLNPF